MTDLWSAVPSSLRRLRRDPLFTVSIVLCLGLAFGALAGMVAVTDAVLLRALPFREPDRLLAIWKGFDAPGQEGLRYFLRAGEADFLRRSAIGFDVAATLSIQSDLTVPGGEGRRVRAAWTTANLASLVGMPVVEGRWFDVEEEESRAEVAIVSDAFARQASSREHVVVDGRSYRIIGVVSAESAYPDGTDLWLPLRQSDWESQVGLGVVGRPRAGVPVAAAVEEVRGIGTRLRELDPALNRTAGLDADLLQTQLAGDLRDPLLGLLAAAALLYLVASANAASLVLARSARRRAETAIRCALGASSLRILRLHAADLGLATGAALGLGATAAALLVGPTVAASPLDLPGFVEIRVDHRALLVVLALAVATVAGLVALATLTTRWRPTVPGARGAGGGSLRFRRALGRLVVLDLAATAVLTTLAVHGAATVGAMLDRATGFDLDTGWAVGISAPGHRNTSLAERAAFFDEVLAATRSLPGIDAAGTTHHLPMTQPEYYWSFRRTVPGPDEAEQTLSLYHAISDGFLEAIGLDVVEGRGLLPTDGPEAPRVLLVNRSFVAHHFPDRSPLGETIESTRDGLPLEIVGVVEDAAERGLALPPEPCVYRPVAQYDRPFFSVAHLVVRTRLPAAAWLPALGERIRDIEPEAVVFAPHRLREDALGSVRGRRFTRSLLSGLATLAMVLAAAGVFGLSAYEVSTRGAELAVRSALGATGPGLWRLVVGASARRAAVGLLAAAAILGALAHAPWPGDGFAGVPPSSYAVGGLVLLAVVLLASGPAALRASRVEPARALRSE